MIPITLNLEPIVKLTPEQSCQICESNPEAKLEMTSLAELVVMSPAGGISGNRNAKLTYRLENWTGSNSVIKQFCNKTKREG